MFLKVEKYLIDNLPLYQKLDYYASSQFCSLCQLRTRSRHAKMQIQVQSYSESIIDLPHLADNKISAIIQSISGYLQE
jgi:hypothetical protein